jgi:hypothetical protein
MQSPGMLRRVALVCLVFLLSVFQLLVIVNFVSSSSILFTLMIEAKLSSETSVLTSTTGICSQNTYIYSHKSA